MGSEEAIAPGAGLHLRLNGQRTLSFFPSEKSLQIYEPSAKNRLRSSCKSIVAEISGRRKVPLHNLLWMETSGGKLVIDYAAHFSKSSIRLETWRFELAADSKYTEGTPPEQFVSRVLAEAYGGAQLRKRACVLVNPHAGPGAALRKWNDDVKPLFQAARMDLDVHVLRKGGEAIELSEKIDIDRYDTVVACSGDGTPHEIFNGLAKRRDAAIALSKVAVSHIPCGSGNAMSCNLYGTTSPSSAALSIIKGLVTPIDLVSVTQGDRRTISFLSQSLGIIAESDLGTENLRWMGSSRFEIGILMRIFRRRCYPCDLAVKLEATEKGKIRAHYEQYARESKPTEVLKPNPSENSDEQGLPELKYGTVKDPLPDGWELAKYDNIGNFYCGNMAYMAPNAEFFAAALPCDGCMDLVTVNGDLSPITATKLLYSVENGKFFDSEHVQYRKISAYRIIPRDQKDGCISVDGERIPFEPFQAEIHQGLGRVISKRGMFEAKGPAKDDNVSISDGTHA